MVGAPKGARAEHRLSGAVEHVGSSKQRGRYLAHVEAAVGKWATRDEEMSTTLSACKTLEKQAYILLYSRVLGPRSEDGVKLVEATMRDVVDGTILFSRFPPQRATRRRRRRC